MSVEVVYNGGFGNHMFQYICARLFAERNGLALKTEFSLPDMVRFSLHKDGAVFSDPTVVVTDRKEIFSKAWDPARYVFNGYFQKADWYYGQREKIEAFTSLRAVPRQDPRDAVAHIRVLDYKESGIVIHPSWYLGILSNLTFRNLFLVIGERDMSYIDQFARYNPVVVSGSMKDDWDFIRSFDTILCSNSTYCWWATFFSSAKRVFTFKRWIRNPAADLTRFPNAVEVDGAFLNNEV
jgi:hypothetical protein